MDKKEAVDKFLTKVFDDTLIVDLKQMLSTPQGLDFGIIILVCSGIDLIGALDQGHLGKSTWRFKEALTKYFPGEGYLKYKNVFYNLFRCGLAHQAFIKPGTATARNPAYEHCHLQGVYIEGEKGALLFIHPNVFAKHFFQAVETFRNSLENDSSKVETAYRAIQEIYKGYPTVSEALELCRSLPPLPPDGPSSVTRMPQPTTITASEALVV